MHAVRSLSQIFNPSRTSVLNFQDINPEIHSPSSSLSKPELAPLPTVSDEDDDALWDFDETINDLTLEAVYERVDDFFEKQHDFNVSAPTVEIDFMLKLAFALVVNGMNSAHMESLIVQIAKRLGFHCSISLQPRQISACFTASDSTPFSSRTRTYIIHCEDAGAPSNIAVLSLLYTLAEAIAAGRLSLESGFKALLDILERPPMYSKVPRVVACGVACAGLAALFFYSSLIGIIIAFVCGALEMAIEVWLRPRFSAFGKMNSFLTPLIMSMIVGTLYHLLPAHSFEPISVLLMSLMWILPGLSLTSAVTELARQNLSVGSARLFFSIMVMILMSYGIQIGFYFLSFITDRPLVKYEGELLEPTLIVMLLEVLCIGISFCVLVHAPLNLWYAMISANYLSFLTYFYVFATYTDVAVLGTALCGGFYARIWSKITGKTLIIPLTSALIMLVPGSLSVRSILQVVVFDDASSGLALSGQVIKTAVSLAVGVLISTSSAK
ncbi:hypothetical protein RCL1_002483 [Eukaryota sp. TZLM3-RCL]